MDDVMAHVATLLPDEQLTLVETLSDGERSTVLRVRADAASGSSRTLIVKRYRRAGESHVRECAALATLPDNAPSPTLVAESADPPIAVLSDLGAGTNVATALLGDDPSAATDALVRWAQGLAAIHCATRDSGERFQNELAARAGGATVHLTSMRVLIEDAVRVLDRECGALGVVVPPGAWEEFRGLADLLGADGATALTPADTCPDNCVLIGEDLVLVDFEDAQFRHIAWDVAYLRVPWPSCWCAWALPTEVADAAVAAYRAVAAQAFPQVADDGFMRDVEAATAGWALIGASASLDLALQESDRDPDDDDPDKPTPTRRSRVLHRLELAARIEHEPALAALSAALATELRSRWGADIRLETAPAYRRSS